MSSPNLFQKSHLSSSQKILSFCFDQFEQTGLINRATVRAMKEFKNILLVVDPRTSSDSQIIRALTFANGKDAKITIAAVVESGVNTPGLVDIIVEIQEKLAPLAQIAEAVNVDTDIRVFVGRAFTEIIVDVISNGRDLVIKPIEPRKAGFKLFAGTDFKLLRKCPCPLLLLRDTDSHRFKSIVAAVDVDSDNPENDLLSAKILDLAHYMTARDASDYHIVHAWQLEHEEYLRSPRTGLSHYEVEELRKKERQQRNDKLTNWIGHFPLGCLDDDKPQVPQVHLKNGSAKNEIPKSLDELHTDLIIMGTVARTGIPGFFIGNTAEDILNQVHCSVFALKPDGFVSPVVAEKDLNARGHLRSVT